MTKERRKCQDYGPSQKSRKENFEDDIIDSINCSKEMRKRMNTAQGIGPGLPASKSVEY